MDFALEMPIARLCNIATFHPCATHLANVFIAKHTSLFFPLCCFLLDLLSKLNLFFRLLKVASFNKHLCFVEKLLSLLPEPRYLRPCNLIWSTFFNLFVSQLDVAPLTGHPLVSSSDKFFQVLPQFPFVLLLIVLLGQMGLKLGFESFRMNFATGSHVPLCAMEQVLMLRAESEQVEFAHIVLFEILSLPRLGLFHVHISVAAHKRVKKFPGLIHGFRRLPQQILVGDVCAVCDTMLALGSEELQAIAPVR